MNLIAHTPNIRIGPSPQGRISITIGTLAVESRRDKAHPCHLRGTEVIGQSPQVHYLRVGESYSSVSIYVLRLSRSACRWNDDCGKTSLRSQFLEGR